MDDQEEKKGSKKKVEPEPEPDLTGLIGWPDHLRPFVEAHARYEQALVQALNEDRIAIERITLDYWVACNEAQSDASRLRAAYDNCQGAMEKEQAAALERRRSSYRDYILAMQSSWAGADAEQYDPSSLHVIGSSMQVVAAESVWTGTPVTPR